MIKSFKYRIYPKADQKTLIDKTIGCCRFVYNLALETKINAYNEMRINLSAYDLQKQLTDLKKDCVWLHEVNSQSLDSAIKTMDDAYRGFFSGKGYPKFKKKQNSGSFKCRNNARKVDWENSTLTIPKIKNIPIVLSRKFEGEIRTITISRSATGKYFASIMFETHTELPNKKPIHNAIGIDLGITSFATLSTGEKIDNRRHLKTELGKIKRLQRWASRKKKDSFNWRKANLRVATLHEKIVNQRKDFLHKLSTRLIRDNQTDTICVESLAVKNMIKNHRLAQAISDASWFEFVRQLEYKGLWYGKNIVKIDRFYASSKICSACGSKRDSLALSVRQWSCELCGAYHDRDINAAINIKNIGVGSTELTPTEIGLLEAINEVGISANLTPDTVFNYQDKNQTS